MSRVAAVLIIILLITPAIANDRGEDVIMKNNDGRTLYVGGSGPDNYTKIQDAIDDAKDGDTVFVYSGTYYENIVIRKSINLMGEDKNTAIIDGGGKGDTVFLNATGVNISNFTIQNGSAAWYCAGIYIRGRNNIISGNIIKNNKVGIIADGIYSVYNEIEKNIIFGNRVGIDLFNAYKNGVRENIIFDNKKNYNDGIVVSDASGNIIENNILGDTIYLGRAYGNIVKNNSFTQEGISIWESSGNKVFDNKINGKPIIYLENKKDMEISEGAQIILVKCEGIKIKNLHISNTCTAIHLSYCKRCVIEKNTIENNSNGIEIYNSRNIIIRNNKISNSTYYGTLIWSSFMNIIRRNSFEKNRWGLDIAIYSALNLILKNNFKSNECGINMTLSFANAVLRNNFLENKNDENFTIAPITLWLRNYWDTWKLPLPKPLHGYGGNLEPCVKFDWMPRLRAYDWEA